MSSESSKPRSPWIRLVQGEAPGSDFSWGLFAAQRSWWDGHHHGTQVISDYRMLKPFEQICCWWGMLDTTNRLLCSESRQQWCWLFPPSAANKTWQQLPEGQEGSSASLALHSLAVMLQLLQARPLLPLASRNGLLFCRSWAETSRAIHSSWWMPSDSIIFWVIMFTAGISAAC